MARTASFRTTRLNPTTFLITEDDSFSEHPFIYAKLHPELPVLLLSDTGCNSPRDKSVDISCLREYLETYPVSCNDNRPLDTHSPDGGTEREYIIICTHCHYDHIGGLEEFNACPTPISPSSPVNMTSFTKSLRASASITTIVASAHDPTFITHDLSRHSLCEYNNISVPAYEVSYWASDHEDLEYNKTKLGVKILHTPGHTPDELAWYDEKERWLYVGDSFYERGDEGMSIIFPNEGNWIDFMTSLSKLIAFVQDQNQVEEERLLQADRVASIEGEDDGWVLVPRRVKIGCGHQTSAADGEEISEVVQSLFWRILNGRVPVNKSTFERGEVVDLWQETGTDGRFSVRAPRRLVKEARKHFQL